jgi:hypothetical protein
MLIYHPAFDAYHCTLRFIALLTAVRRIDVEKARILDYYLAFPSAILSMRLPAELNTARPMLRRLKNIYRDPIAEQRTFAEMRHVQLSALNCLAASEIIDADELSNGIVERSKHALPGELEEAVQQFAADEGEVIELLTSKIADIPTAGPNGLKDRSGLLEYRYDIA